jgi:adenylate cyclase
MVGYSRRMSRDEEGTAALVRRLRAEVFDPAIADHDGRLVKFMGDGFLAEFASAVEAVRAALAIQDGIGARADSGDDPVAFRVGVNLGDIVIDGDDLVGEGVNIAARLEGLATPGAVCISSKVYDEVRNKIDVAFQDLGDQTVKNIDTPIRAYLVRARQGETASPPVAAADAFPAEKPAVAVLPFVNRSGDPEQEYFSDGLSEDIITLLSAWRSFPVIARNSSFAFKGQSVDVRSIARDLGARYVIEGSVRKAGNRVRVTAQLIDAESGHQIWADRFDRSLDDIFEIQDEITRGIVSVVEPEMERAERTRALATRASNLTAWDLYLQGRELLHKVTEADNAAARQLFEQAIALDPGYSDAWAGLSYTYQREVLLEVAEDRRQAVTRSLETARKAVTLDGDSSIAHFALAGAYIWDNQHQSSIAETRIAAELNPSNGHAWLALGNRLDIVGQPDEGLPLLEKSLQLHRRDPHRYIYFGQLARAYIVAGAYDKALDCLNTAIRTREDHPHTWHLMAICLGHMGRAEEARAAAAKCEALHPGFIAKRAHWNIYVDPASNAHLTDGLRKVGLVD